MDDDKKQQDERAETRRVEDRERTVRNVVMLADRRGAGRDRCLGHKRDARPRAYRRVSLGGPPQLPADRSPAALG